jgi:hypothetical protein
VTPIKKRCSMIILLTKDYGGKIRKKIDKEGC